MPTQQCAINGCVKPAKSKGWCGMHYARWQRHGDPMAVAFVVGDDEARFLAKVRVMPGGCWHWTAYISPAGYGKFGSKEPLAHRWAYSHFVGSIPEGWTVDHECHNRDKSCKGGPTCLHRRCVNPTHLVPVATVPENVANSPNALQYRTHCPQGHPYDEANTYISPKGYRNCRRCHVIKQTILNRKKRAAAKAARQGVRIVPKG